jgi:hypothetical protein
MQSVGSMGRKRGRNAMMCEKCWADAYLRSVCNGKTQAENYCNLLEERKDDPCNDYEQKHGRRVNEFRNNPVGESND